MEGGRYDVCLPERTMSAVYWREGRPTEIRRCSWFYKSNTDGRWTPYDEETSR